MELVLMPTAEEAAKVVADIFEDVLTRVAAPTLGLATGSTPVPVYQDLIARHRAGQLTFEHARAFLLDEYCGLEPGDPNSYRSFIHREFTDQVDMAPSAVAGPDVTLPEPEIGARYEEDIVEAGGVDIQLLGIGTDGHIGFNEPTSSLQSRTRFKTLTAATRSDNARFFGGDASRVPRHVVTQGIGTILEARRVVLLATGAHKSEPVRLAVEGPLSSMVPASALQLHPRATLVVDEQAADGLSHADYFREVYENKPGWQRP